MIESENEIKTYLAPGACIPSIATAAAHQLQGPQTGLVSFTAAVKLFVLRDP